MPCRPCGKYLFAEQTRQQETQNRHQNKQAKLLIALLPLPVVHRRRRLDLPSLRPVVRPQRPR